MKNKEKKQKPVFVDDGRTIADMDGVGNYQTKEQRKKREEIRALHLTKKEERAIYRGVFKHFLPYFLIFIFVFVSLLLSMYFRMRG